jgi:hypothetical protein
VRAEDRVRRVQQRRVARQRFLREHIEPCAAETPRIQFPGERILVEDPPRATLTTTAPSGSRASSRAPSKPRVCADSAQREAFDLIGIPIPLTLK